LNFRLN